MPTALRRTLLLAALAVALPASAAQAAPFDDVFADYRADGAINLCAYSPQQLADAQAATPPDVAAYSPDFVLALSYAIAQRGEATCGVIIVDGLPVPIGSGSGETATTTAAALLRARLTSALAALQRSLRGVTARSLARRTSFLLTFQAPTAGELEAIARATPVAGTSRTTTIAKGRRVVARAGQVRLRVRTTKAGRRALRRAKRKMRITIRATFTPDNDADNPVKVSRSFSVRRR